MPKILAISFPVLLLDIFARIRWTSSQGGSDQIPRAIDLIFLLQSHWDAGPQQEHFLLSIYIQKAFDSVSWPYLFDVLEQWGFGDKFLRVIHTLYSNLNAQIRLMGHYSDTQKRD